MLVFERHIINRKRTYRIYREEGFHVGTKKRKKIVRPCVPMLVTVVLNQHWSMNSVSDQLANRRRLRALKMVDDFTRECVLKIADFSISAQRLPAGA